MAIPSLFGRDQATAKPSQKASILRDPPSFMTRKRSTALPLLDVSQTVPKKRGCGRPCAIRVDIPTADAHDIVDNVVDNLNNTLPTLYSTRCCRRQQPIPPPTVIAPPDYLPYNNDETVLRQINIRNLQDNVDLTHRTGPTREPTHATMQHVTENTEQVDMARHFPCLGPLTTTMSNDLQLKSGRDVPHQKVNNKIIDQLNSKTMHFYNLPFALDTFLF